MSGSSNSSFIPKRGPAARKRKNPTHRIYIFSLVSYILMFSALLASGAVFLYGSYVNRLFDAEVKAFSLETQGFDEAKMERIVEFEERLNQASVVFDSTFSIATVFDALEKATAKTAQLEGVDIKIESNGEGTEEVLLAEATVVTDSFDSAIFQRKFYEESGIFTEVGVEDVKQGAAPTSEEGGSSVSTEGVDDFYNFSLSLEILLTDIPPTNVSVETEDVFTDEPATQEQAVEEKQVLSEESVNAEEIVGESALISDNESDI